MDLGWGLLLPIRRRLDSGYRIRTKEVKAASLKHGTSRDFIRSDSSATRFWTLHLCFFLFFLSFSSFLCFPSQGFFTQRMAFSLPIGRGVSGSGITRGSLGALFMFLAAELCEGIISSARFLRCLLSIRPWWGGDIPYQAFLASL